VIVGIHAVQDGEEELYDLVADPSELVNRARAGKQTARVITQRRPIRQSSCRPPKYEPLGYCLRSGTQGPDHIEGRRRRDWICANGGNDTIDVRFGGRDTVSCGAGLVHVRADDQDNLHGCERHGRSPEVVSTERS
jgi:hypothetical protein